MSPQCKYQRGNFCCISFILDGNEKLFARQHFIALSKYKLPLIAQSILSGVRIFPTLHEELNFRFPIGLPADTSHIQISTFLYVQCTRDIIECAVRFTPLHVV